MTSYAKITDFASKDALLTGNPAKIVKGVEIDDEFNAIATADATSVKGPIGVTVDNTVVRWDGTTGRAVQGSGVTISDADVVTASGFTGPHNGTVGATTPSTGAFTTLSASGVIGGQSELQLNAVNAAIRLQTGGTNKWALINDFPSAGQMTVYDHASTANRAVFSSTGLAVTGALSATGSAAVGTSTISGSSASGSATVLTVRDTANNNLASLRLMATAVSGYEVYSTAASLNFYDVANSTVRGTFSSTGLAVTGALSATGKISNTAGGAEFAAASSSAILKLSRTTTNAGEGWLGADVNYAFRTYNSALTASALLVTQDAVSNTAIVSSTGLAVTGIVTPEADNTRTLGTGALRWSTVYAGTGTINTSDAREKTEVASLTTAEINAAKQLSKEIGTYKFLTSVQSKGDAARTHVGMTVQRAIAIMEENGLDPFGYGFICHDVWEDKFVEHPAIDAADAVLDENGDVVTPAVEGKAAWTEQTQVAGDRYAFRYDQLNMFIAAGIEARLAALEAA